MGKREALGARIRDALDNYSNNASHNELSRLFFGLEVAAHEGVSPYPAAVVESWMYGALLPAFSTLRAIAKTARLDDNAVGLRWLVFGAECAGAEGLRAVEESEFLRYYEGERTGTHV